MIAWDHVTRSDVLRAPPGPLSGLRNWKSWTGEEFTGTREACALWMLQIEN
jgi:hypothetical protein